MRRCANNLSAVASSGPPSLDFAALVPVSDLTIGEFVPIATIWFLITAICVMPRPGEDSMSCKPSSMTIRVMPSMQRRPAEWFSLLTTRFGSWKSRSVPVRMAAICLLQIRCHQSRKMRGWTMTLSSDDQYAHLRANAATQKQETLNRLTRAIATLEADGRPVTTFTIREVSGLDYMAYYRNRAAFRLFQQHSTHLRKKRAQEQAKRHAPSRGSKRKKRKGTDALHAVTVSPRDQLLDYQR